MSHTFDRFYLSCMSYIFSHIPSQISQKEKRAFMILKHTNNKNLTHFDDVIVFVILLSK